MSYEEDQPDGPFMRFAKFIAIIVMCGFLAGALSAGIFYLKEYKSARREMRGGPKSQEENPMAAMKKWFFAGGAIGGALGLCYVARCIVKGEDP